MQNAVVAPFLALALDSGLLNGAKEFEFFLYVKQRKAG